MTTGMFHVKHLRDNGVAGERVGEVFHVKHWVMLVAAEPRMSVLTRAGVVRSVPRLPVQNGAPVVGNRHPSRSVGPT